MTFKQHAKATALLSLPIIISQVGHIVTTMADNIFLGFIGIEQQAAGILSGNVFTLLLVFAIGMSQGLTPLIAEAHVTNKLKEKASLLKNSLFLNFLTSLLLVGAAEIFIANIHLLHQPEDVVQLSKPFIRVIAFSLIPVTIFFTFKQYAEGLSNTKASMYISISGNILNIVLNYGLIYGKGGLPALGYMGAAWATFWARMFMALSFVLYVVMQKNMKEVLRPFFQEKINQLIFKNLFSIGIGPAMQYFFETAAFASAGIMAGWIGKITLDAHGIALSLAAFTYMFTGGISSAASIRVANFKGLNDWDNIKKAGNVGFSLSVFVMLLFALLLIGTRDVIPSFFNSHSEVVDTSASLLLVAALFQLFDGVQITGLGVLRGLSDVKIPTLIALTAYWGIALPTAYYLGFTKQNGIHGIWYGLTAGLVFAAATLYTRFQYLIKKNIIKKYS
ncbi:MAG: MATE family efflux transporter [Bacteroidetes bacterium]|nr:MATE family efflux transporter [Bacteroidota bacterium]